jgi:CubicO group peptidase (beta-lactamase class C family)
MKRLKTLLVAMVFFVLQNNAAYSQAQEEVNREIKISQILIKYKVPGAGIALISKDSVIWSLTPGLADIKNNIPVSNSTLFAIGSISKTVLAAAAMIAQEQGLLDINSPIEQLVPTLNYQNEWSDTDPVRLIHLLEHTSGFDEAHFNVFAHGNSYTPFSEVMKFAGKSLETRWRPGSYFEYNTFGYIVAAHAIEENVGMSLEDFVGRNFLLPMGMDQATYHPKDSITPNFSKGYEGSESKEVPFPDIPQWPAGALTATIDDMADFVSMFLNNGMVRGKQIITASSIKLMETPETSFLAKTGVQYGYGKGIWGKVEDGHLFYGHTGRIGGFLSEFGYSKELNVGYVILINSAEGNKAIKEIKKELLSSLGVSKVIGNNQTTKANINLALADQLAGCYQPITSVPQLGKIGYFIYRLIDMPIIMEENGQLYQSSLLGGKEELLYIKDLTFRKRGEPKATSAFVKTQNNNWQWVTTDGSYQKINIVWGYLQFFLAATCVVVLVLSFIIHFVMTAVSLIRKSKENFGLQLFPFLAVSSFVCMLVSVLVFYNPEKLYSLGAVIFLISGWSFFAFSFLGLIKVVSVIYKKSGITSWIKYYSLLTTLACCITVSYLLYWDIIGLMLWNY